MQPKLFVTIENKKILWESVKSITVDFEVKDVEHQTPSPENEYDFLLIINKGLSTEVKQKFESFKEIKTWWRRTSELLNEILTRKVVDENGDIEEETVTLIRDTEVMIGDLEDNFYKFILSKREFENIPLCPYCRSELELISEGDFEHCGYCGEMIE